MSPHEFEAEVVRRLPALGDAVSRSSAGLHGLMEALYVHTQECIAAGCWDGVEAVFRLLEEAYISSSPADGIEDALHMAFFPFFDYQGQRARVRSLMGPVLRRVSGELEGRWESILQHATRRHESWLS